MLPVLLLVAACSGSAPSAGDEDALRGGNGIRATKHYCTPWTARCVDENTSAECAGDGNSDVRVRNCWAELQTKCSPATGYCDVCVPNARSCNAYGDAIECNPRGDGYDGWWGCSSAGVACLPSGTCGCHPGQWECVGNVSSLCNQTGDGDIDQYDCSAIGRWCTSGGRCN